MRILIALLITSVLITGCSSERNNGAPSPKAIADILFNGLKENAFGEVANLVPLDEKDSEAFVRQTSEEEEEQNTGRYSRQKFLKELELAFNVVRVKYNEAAWKSAMIVSYDGIDTYRRYAHLSVTIQLEDRRDILYVGKAEEKDGKWYLVTAPEWD